MASNTWWTLFRNRKKVGSVIDKTEDYSQSTVGSISIPDNLKEDNAFILANTVTEIYFPIDFYADRCSKLRYYIADKTGKEITNTELNRFLTSINPLYSFSDLVYQYVFSYMADGNSMTYLQVPKMFAKKDNYKGANVNNITRADILQPNLVDIYEYYNVSLLEVSSLNDLIRQIRYNDNSGRLKELIVSNVKIDCIDANKRDTSNILSKSPLFKAVRPINNLLATYSARYNVYVNNGAAGYIVKKNIAKSAVESAVSPGERQDILDDINNRQGLTGHRNLWGVSGVPIEFINTLISIKDLMPFEETLEDSLKIAGVYQIPTGLVPRKDQSTYDNQGEYEVTVWENGLMSMVKTVCENFTKNFTLDKAGYKIMADFSTVGCLKANDTEIEDVNTKKIANLEKLRLLYPEKTTEINIEIDKIITGYGQR